MVLDSFMPPWVTRRGARDGSLSAGTASIKLLTAPAEAPPASPPASKSLRSRLFGRKASRGELPLPGAAAAQAAALVAKRLAQAAKSAPPHATSDIGSQWVKAGGPAIEAMLEHVHLVDARYLIALGELGGVIARWQDTPPLSRQTRAE